MSHKFLTIQSNKVFSKSWQKILSEIAKTKIKPQDMAIKIFFGYFYIMISQIKLGVVVHTSNLSILSQLGLYKALSQAKTKTMKFPSQ